MTETFFVPAYWEGDTSLNQKALDYFQENKIKSVALFASVQFPFEAVKKQLESLGIVVKTTKARRTSNVGQILGCDAYHDSFQEPIIQECDAILYIGDGLFHPKALLLCQIKEKEFKEVVMWNPISQVLDILKKEIIEKQVARTKRNLKMFVNAEKVGILVTIKPGQQYFNAAKRLKKHLEKQGKKAYIFIDDTLDMRHLENYPFIEAWVNTACPRIGMDDITSIPQPMINLREAADPLKELERLEGD